MHGFDSEPTYLVIIVALAVEDQAACEASSASDQSATVDSHEQPWWNPTMLSAVSCRSWPTLGHEI